MPRSSATGCAATSAERPLRDLVAALFFLSFGRETSPAELTPYLLVAVLLALGRARAGAALTARGEFSIVIAELAVTAGHTEIGPLASAYVVLLGIVGPLLARFADPVARAVLRSPAAPAAA